METAGHGRCGWRGSLAEDDIVGGGAWRNSALCAATLVCEFLRRIVDRHVWACEEVVPGKVSTGG